MNIKDKQHFLKVCEELSSKNELNNENLWVEALNYERKKSKMLADELYAIIDYAEFYLKKPERLKFIDLNELIEDLPKTLKQFEGE